jgi:mono/diheme cytochrome c family protein
MRKMLALLPMMLIACGDKDGDSAAAATGDAANGATLYSSNCAGCHGADGTGVSGPDLTSGLVSGMTDDQISDVIANGVGSMPAVLSDDQEIADVLAYLRQEWG